jgi:hypothetical protein
MFAYALHSLRGSREAAAILYFSQGHQIFQTLREAAIGQFGALAEVSSFLDFASGWGRLTRFLVTELAPERVSVCEIDPAAVRFQSETFGVSGWVSTSDPAGFHPDREYSLILAASFFSHLPAATFAPWAKALSSALAPGGLLLFSTHGPDLLDPSERALPEGILYRRQSETERLDPGDYGTSYVSERFVREALWQAAGGEAAVAAYPRGLCGHQDLYTVSRPAGETRPRRPAAITLFPRGELDLFTLENDGTLVFGGWAADENGESSLSEVELLVGGVVVDRAIPGARWRFERKRDLLSPDDVILVRAVNARGFQNIIAMGTLRTHPPAARVDPGDSG